MRIQDFAFNILQTHYELFLKKKMVYIQILYLLLCTFLSENLPTLPMMQLAASVGDAGVLGL